MDNKRNKTVSPGDFVPNWDAAVGSTNNGLACYDIPITPTYHFKAIYVDERNGKPSAGKVNVYQKLVIVKDVKSNRMDQYILTLIPSKLYDSRNGAQTCNNFINCADKGGFTGVALYSCVYSQVTARISTFKNGVKTRGVFLLNASGKTNLSDKYEQARALASTVYIQKKKMVLTRGEDDYNYDYDYGNEDDYTYIGETLEEVIITPESNNNETSGGNDEWEIIAPPDSGTIDPEPTEPESTSTEDDTVTEKPTTNTGDEDSQLSTALKDITPILKKVNIDISKYKIVQGTGQCPVNAQTLANNTIEICTEFYNHKDNERASIIWHEIYHINNGHNQANSTKSPCSEIILVPTGHILEGLNHYVEWRLDGVKDSKQYDSLLEGEKDFMCSEFSLKNDPQWYLNEVKTYNAERDNGIEKLPYYEGLIDFMQWKYEQLYEYSKNK